MPCSVCGNENYKIIGAPVVEPEIEKFIRRDYKAVKCRLCGFYYVEPEIDLTSYEWSRILEENHSSQPNDLCAKEMRESVKNRFDRLVSYTGVKEIDFLDVGCGKGIAIEEALSRGWKVTAVDFIDSRANGAKAEGVTFYEGSLNKLNFKNKKFDIVYMDSVLERTAEPVEYLSKLSQLLKNDGYAYVSVSNKESLANDIVELRYKTNGREKTAVRISPFSTPFTLSGFNKSSLRKAVEKAGLKSMEFNYFGCSKWGKTFPLKLSAILQWLKPGSGKNFMEIILTKV